MNLANIALGFIKKKMRQQGLIERCLELENGYIQCYDNGSDKPALVLVNGFGASTEFQWYKVTKALGKNHRLIVVNLLNFGRSKPKENHQATLENQVEALFQLLPKLNLQSAHFFGISYGGLVVTEFAHTHNNKVQSLTLIDAPTKFLNLHELEEFLRAEGIKSVHEFFIPTDYHGLQEQFRLAYHKARWLPNFVAKSFYEALCKPYEKGWTEIVNDLLNNYDQLKARSYQFETKVHLIWGQHDRIIPVDVGERLHGHFKNASLHIIKNCGHLPTIEQPNRFVDIVLNNVLQR